MDPAVKVLEFDKEDIPGRQFAILRHHLKIKVPYEVRDNILYLHQTEVFSYACTGAHAKLGAKRSAENLTLLIENNSGI